MFAGPIGVSMLISEWLLLYFAWVHPWSWRPKHQHQQHAAVGDASGGGEDAVRGGEGRIELGLLVHAESRGHDHNDDSAEDQAAPDAPAAQAAAIRSMYDEMGPITRTQKATPPPSTLLFHPQIRLY